jgi:hypothetical protein
MRQTGESAKGRRAGPPSAVRRPTGSGRYVGDLSRSAYDHRLPDWRSPATLIVFHSDLNSTLCGPGNQARTARVRVVLALLMLRAPNLGSWAQVRAAATRSMPTLSPPGLCSSAQQHAGTSTALLLEASAKVTRGTHQPMCRFAQQNGTSAYYSH